MAQMISCGQYELPEDQTFHYAGYECAAWWQDTHVKAGRYEVRAYVEDGHVKEFFVTLTGTIVADNFQALWVGTPIGKAYDQQQNAGKPGEYHLRAYSYNVPADKSGRWHIDYAVLPNVGRCVHCGTVTFGYNTYGWILCSDCTGYVNKVHEHMITIRFPRLLRTLRCYRYGNIAESTLAQAFYDRSEYHREEVAKWLPLIRKARRQFGYPEQNYFHVTDEGRVVADHKTLGSVK